MENLFTGESIKVFDDYITKLSNLKDHSGDGNQDIQTEFPDISKLVLDLVSDAVYGKVVMTDVITKLKSDSLLKEKHSNLQDIFIDTFWFLGTQLTPKSPEWITLCKLIKNLMDINYIDMNKLKISLEISLLVDIGGIIQDESRIQKLLIKNNTTMFYQQQKYNLLREETEGYAKLIVALSQLPMSFIEADIHIRHIFSLIGQFDLEPNRAMDIIVDAYENQPLNYNFIRLLHYFKSSHIASIVGLKFTYYHPSADSEGKTDSVSGSSTSNTTSVTTTVGASKGSSSTVTSATTATTSTAVKKETTNIIEKQSLKKTTSPESLYTVTALLLAHDVITLDQIYPYLLPLIDDMVIHMKQQERSLQKEISSFGVVSLTATSSSTDNNSTTPSKDSNSIVTIVATNANVPRPPPPKGLPPGGSSSVPPPPPPDKPRPPGSSSSTTSSSTPNKKDTKSNSTTTTVTIPEPLVSPTVIEEWDDDTTAEITLQTSFYADGNQVTGLISALISLRCWSLVQPLIQVFRSKHVDLMRIVCIREALTALLEWRCSLLYQTHCCAKYHLAGSFPLDSLQSTPQSDVLSTLSIWHDALKRSEVLPYESMSCTDSKRLALQFTSHQIVPYLSIETFPVEILDMAELLGSNIGLSPILFTQLCRLLRAHRDYLYPLSVHLPIPLDDISRQEMFSKMDSVGLSKLDPMLRIVSTILLPALTITTDGNYNLSGLLWTLLSPLPFSLRYMIYDHIKVPGLGKEALGKPEKSTEVCFAEIKTLHACKGFIKRLSKENIKMVGCQLARLSHSTPLPVFNHILTQIEVFDNLIPVVVEALKFSSHLSRDILSSMFFTQLQKDGEKLKKGDTHYTLWFSSLSRFISFFYGRYPETELRGLLYFLLKRLQDGQSLDLLILKDLLEKMGKCETLLEMSAQQVEALSGGRILRNELMSVQSGTSVTGGNTSNAAANKNTIAVPPEGGKKGIRIFREELINSHTAVPLLVYIAQIRTRILYDTDTPHLKLISHLYDIAQDVLMQFTEFLVGSVALTGKTLQSLAMLMPSFHTLVFHSGLPISIAFQVVRPIVRAALFSSDTPAGAPEYLRPWHPFSDNIRQVVFQYYNDLRQKYKPTQKHSSESTQSDLETLETMHIEEDEYDPMNIMYLKVDEINIWEYIHPNMIILFWTLQTSDLTCSHERYKAEIKKNKDKLTSLNNASTHTTDSKTLKIRKEEINKLNTTIKELQDEYDICIKTVDIVKRILLQYKDQFILSPNTNTITTTNNTDDDKSTTMDITTESISTKTVVGNETAPSQVNQDRQHRVNTVIQLLLQHCISERILLSPSDALYSVHYCFTLQSYNTPYFSTLSFMNKFIQTIVPTLYCVTEAEANCLGYAISDILKMISKLYIDKHYFHEESSKDGFIIGAKKNNSTMVSSSESTPADSTHTTTTSINQTSSVKPMKYINYNEYKKVMKHYITTLTHILIQALSSHEFMYLRSALYVLSKITDYYPTTVTIGNTLLKQVDKIEKEQESAGRMDLQLMAKGVGTLLRRKASTWTNEDGTPIVTNDSTLNINKGHKGVKSSTSSNTDKSNTTNTLKQSLDKLKTDKTAVRSSSMTSKSSTSSTVQNKTSTNTTSGNTGGDKSHSSGGSKDIGNKRKLGDTTLSDVRDESSSNKRLSVDRNTNRDTKSGSERDHDRDVKKVSTSNKTDLRDSLKNEKDKDKDKEKDTSKDKDLRADLRNTKLDDNKNSDKKGDVKGDNRHDKNKKKGGDIEDSRTTKSTIDKSTTSGTGSSSNSSSNTRSDDRKSANKDQSTDKTSKASTSTTKSSSSNILVTSDELELKRKLVEQVRVNTQTKSITTTTTPTITATATTTTTSGKSKDEGKNKGNNSRGDNRGDHNMNMTVDNKSKSNITPPLPPSNKDFSTKNIRQSTSNNNNTTTAATAATLPDLRTSSTTTNANTNTSTSRGNNSAPPPPPPPSRQYNNNDNSQGGGGGYNHNNKRARR